MVFYGVLLLVCAQWKHLSPHPISTIPTHMSILTIFFSIRQNSHRKLACYFQPAFTTLVILNTILSSSSPVILFPFLSSGEEGTRTRTDPDRAAKNTTLVALNPAGQNVSEHAVCATKEMRHVTAKAH